MLSVNYQKNGDLPKSPLTPNSGSAVPTAGKPLKISFLRASVGGRGDLTESKGRFEC
jgi:hypothetical protein